MAKDKKDKSGGASGAKGRRKTSPPARRGIADLTEEERDEKFREISSAEEKQYLLDLYDSQNLTQEQRTALSYYKGNGFTPINAILRNMSEGIRQPRLDFAQSQLPHLDTIPFDSPEDLTLYRGLNNESPAGKEIYNMFKAAHDSGDMKGTLFQDKGYGSTSVQTSSAMGFGGAILFKVRAPKGTKILVPNRNDVVYGDEKEIILNKNTTYRAISSTITTNALGKERLVVEVEAIQE